MSHWPGPLPWAEESYLDEQRAALTAADFQRLHLCEWAEGGEGLAMIDDIEAACTLDPQPWQDGRQYVIALDLGVAKDRTAVVVGHLEPGFLWRSCRASRSTASSCGAPRRRPPLIWRRSRRG